MSKAVKTIVSVVAAVAIPFAAPAIASSIGLSAAIGGAVGSATVGAVLGGAVTGAALGAVKGAVLGEDVGRSALFGGIGGGIGGYTTTASAVTAPAGGAVGGTGLTVPPAGAPAGASPYALAGGNTGLTTPAGGAAASGTGLTVPGATTASGLTTSGAGLSGAMTSVDYSLTAGVPHSQGLSVASGGTYSPTLAAGMGATPTAALRTFGEALSRAGDAIKTKFTDPKALADLTLRAAGQLAGSALAGTGMSAEEQALLNAQTGELRMLQSTNQALFNQRLEQAQNLIGESKYFDPEYFGLQHARRAQVTGAHAKRAGLRGLTGGAREAEARRFDLATSRDAGTAYDVGYGTGVSGRLQTMQAGLSQMPTSFPSSMGEYSNLRQAYAGAAQRRSQQARDIGSLFGSLTGRSG